MRAIRYRLLTIVLIGVVTSAISLVALVRVLSVTTVLRQERAREAVAQEAARLAHSTNPTMALAAPPAMAFIGMRGGYWDHGGPQPLVPREWGSMLLDVLHRAAAAGQPATAEQQMGPSVLVLRAQPAGPPGKATCVWAGFLVEPSYFLHTWQVLVTLLAIATALLVSTTISAVVAFKRNTAALHRCLLALADDLSTPIPRPRIRELGELADGIAVLAQNLAQSRRLQERLGRKLNQQERLAALGRVVAGVAHEVRNPLASIKLRLDLAAASTTLPAAAEKAIIHASDEIVRLDRLVADLLVVAGRQMGPREQTSVGELVRARIEALQPWCATRGVEIAQQGDAAAVINAAAVGRAVDNLLRNAVEASPPGGVVRAQVGTTFEAVTIKVEDRGQGVVGHTEELFEPFFTTKPDGTGLGLALSRAIARAHGGDLTYVREGLVTRFELTLGVAGIGGGSQSGIGRSSVAGDQT